MHTSTKRAIKEPVKEPEWKPVQCAFSLYVSEKLTQFDKRSRTIAENRISNILFDLEMNSIPPVPINSPPPINHPLPINPPLPINVPRPTNPDPAGNVQNDYERVATAANQFNDMNTNVVLSNGNGRYMTLLQQ